MSPVIFRAVFFLFFLMFVFHPLPRAGPKMDILSLSLKPSFYVHLEGLLRSNLMSESAGLITLGIHKLLSAISRANQRFQFRILLKSLTALWGLVSARLPEGGFVVST